MDAIVYLGEEPGLPPFLSAAWRGAALAPGGGCGEAGVGAAVCSSAQEQMPVWADLRLGRAEFLRGEQEPHRVAPAKLRGRAEGGTAERHDSPADLQLPEAHVVGGDHDASGQGELDGQGKGDAVDRHDHRLGHRLPPHAERVEAVRTAQDLRAVLAAAGPAWHGPPTQGRYRPAVERHPAKLQCDQCLSGGLVVLSVQVMSREQGSGPSQCVGHRFGSDRRLRHTCRSGTFLRKR
jgi:hypothetical protein